MRVCIAIVLLSAVLSAQTIVTGPVVTTNKIAWGMSDGATAAAAQAFEVRVRVDGTLVVVPGATCVVNTVNEGTNVWSFGTGVPPFIQILRNGAQITNSFGLKIAFVNAIYVFGDDGLWYRWNGSAFVMLTSTDPTPAVLDASSVTRWSCQAPLGSALVRLLNVRGTHSVTVRLFDPASRLESIDAVPSSLVTPQVVTQPITVRIIQ